MASTSLSSSIHEGYSSVCASAVNVANFVTTKLQFGEDSNSLINYVTWKEQMLCLIDSQGLIGFINGEVAPEQDVVWRRNDRLVKDWILGALVDKLVRRCVGFDTARDVWLELEYMFSPSNPPSPAHQEQENYGEYLKLYKAALRGEWDTTREILERHPEAAGARVASTLETALHVAVGTGEALDFVENLLLKMSNEDLSIRDRLGRNALHIAALTGNTGAARLLVDMVQGLVYEQAGKGWFPIHAAARSAHRDTLEFLILRTSEHDSNINPYDGQSGVLLLCLVIDAGFYDIALRLVEKYPGLAGMKYVESNTSALETLSRKNLAFPSGARFTFWERLILYLDRVQVMREFSEARRSIANADRFSTRLHDIFRIWSMILVILPLIVVYIVVTRIMRLRLRARTRAVILKHRHAKELLKCLCRKMVEAYGNMEVASIYTSAMMTAAGLGIHEVIEEIVETFPDAVHARRDGYHFFQVAAANRNEQVFNLIYQTKDHKHRYSDITDSNGNTILHLVAKLAPPHKLNLVSGAALQMQCELQWFKEVENFVHPYARELENDDGKTPKMVFTEEHKSLKAEGEKWMKETANSYIIVAALIATVVFAAAITVPGGNNSNTGYPMFNGSTAFIDFAISNVCSLFTFITSLLMFLSIMTSRYAEENFLHALPKRLCIGLLSLSVSIIFMMVAFSESTYMVLGQKKKWVLEPVVALACLPIASFVLLQFPLLWDVISSTYGCGIFGGETDQSPFF